MRSRLSLLLNAFLEQLNPTMMILLTMNHRRDLLIQQQQMLTRTRMQYRLLHLNYLRIKGFVYLLARRQFVVQDENQVETEIRIIHPKV